MSEVKVLISKQCADGAYARKYLPCSGYVAGKASRLVEHGYRFEAVELPHSALALRIVDDKNVVGSFKRINGTERTPEKIIETFSAMILDLWNKEY